MKFLVSSEGAPVIPWFPAPPENVFLVIGEWTKVSSAYSRNVDIDLDKLAEELCQHYPGLPRSLHENYLLETAVAASTLPDGRRVRIFVDTDSAKIQDADTEDIRVLWVKQPVSARPR